MLRTKEITGIYDLVESARWCCFRDMSLLPTFDMKWRRYFNCDDVFATAVKCIQDGVSANDTRTVILRMLIKPKRISKRKKLDRKQ